MRLSKGIAEWGLKQWFNIVSQWFWVQDIDPSWSCHLEREILVLFDVGTDDMNLEYLSL